MCAAGAVQPMRREDLRGTCWQPCKADGSGFETEGCGELTCDGKTADHGNLRRKGTEMVGARREWHGTRSSFRGLLWRVKAHTHARFAHGLCVGSLPFCRT